MSLVHPHLVPMLRAEGLDVFEHPGASTRGSHGQLGDWRAVDGALIHTTAGALHDKAGRRLVHPSLVICRDGRPGTPPVAGPLVQFLLDRDLVLHYLAAGVANHGGRGRSVVHTAMTLDLPAPPPSVGSLDDTANDELLGIEIEHSGYLPGSALPKGREAEALRPEVIDIVARWAACVCVVYGTAQRGREWSPNRIVAHKVWAPLRKVDPPGRTDWSEVTRAKMAPAPTSMTSSTPILAAPTVADNRCAAYLRAARTPAANDYTSVDIDVIVAFYAEACRKAGLPLVVPIAQMIHETGFLTSGWSARPRRNPAGIGVTGAFLLGDSQHRPSRPLPPNHEWQWIIRPIRPAGAWESGVVFATWEEAARCHVGRLLAYVLPAGAGTAAQQDLIMRAALWRAIRPEIRGVAPALSGLGGPGRWAVDPGYGGRLAARVNAIMAAR